MLTGQFLIVGFLTPVVQIYRRGLGGRAPAQPGNEPIYSLAQMNQHNLTSQLMIPYFIEAVKNFGAVALQREVPQGRGAATRLACGAARS